MFGFLKNTKDFYYLGLSFDYVFRALQSIGPKIISATDKSKYKEDILSIAYVCKAGIDDRIRKQNLALSTGIYVSSISKSNVTIEVAYEKTVEIAGTLARMMDIYDEFSEVMIGGELFHVLDKICPRAAKDNLGL